MTRLHICNQCTQFDVAGEYIVKIVSLKLSVSLLSYCETVIDDTIEVLQSTDVTRDLRYDHWQKEV